jgi:UDP-N-acetyl-D-glucosamine dehydrogenase
VAICVPTPLDAHKKPDVSYIKQSASDISKHLRRGMLIVLESTTYPGTTEELLKPILESTGLICGEDFYLAFSPERVDPGNLIYNTKNTPKVVGGIGSESTKIAAALYRKILDSEVHTVSSPAVAEMEKLLENTYRNVNIALANEMAQLCDKMGINVWEVIDAAKTKPYGFQAFYPGPGVGGHCIPLDPAYLSWKAIEYGFHTKLIETSSIINDGMPEYVVNRIARILNRDKKSLNGSKILQLGVAYKQDIDDYRESPALEVAYLLEIEGADIKYYDPYVSEYEYNGRLRKSCSELTPELISEADLVIITTAHTTIDYELISCHARMIFDTKNRMKDYIDSRNREVL